MPELRGRHGPAPDHILTRWIGIDYLSDIKVYEEQGGYQAWKKALTELEPAHIANEVKISGLRGRGGAGRGGTGAGSAAPGWGEWSAGTVAARRPAQRSCFCKLQVHSRVAKASSLTGQIKLMHQHYD